MTPKYSSITVPRSPQGLTPCFHQDMGEAFIFDTVVQGRRCLYHIVAFGSDGLKGYHLFAPEACVVLAP